MHARVPRVALVQCGVLSFWDRPTAGHRNARAIGPGFPPVRPGIGAAADFRAEIARLAVQPAPVTDRNDTGDMVPHGDAADTIFHLDLPVWRLMPRVIRRLIAYGGRVRSWFFYNLLGSLAGRTRRRGQKIEQYSCEPSRLGPGVPSAARIFTQPSGLSAVGGAPQFVCTQSIPGPPLV